MASILGDVYKQYNEDTEFVAGWLAEESLRCGYELTTVHAAPTQKSTGRLKGKARKQAKESNHATSSASYIIKLTDFVPMAQKIAAKLPKIRVPNLVERTLGRAISERRRVSEWFRSCHDQNSDHASDLRHAHFLGVWEGALAIFCPFTDIVKKPGGSRKHKPPGVESLPLQNAFAGLTVKDPLNEPEDQDPTVDTQLEDNQRMPHIAHVELEKDEAELEAEFYFAIECFLEEVQAIRSMIRDTWHVYKRTGYDLVIATLLTNTAIELVRQAENQLELLVDRPAKFLASKFPVWCFPAIALYQLHPSMQSMPLETVVLPSKAVMVVDGPCPHPDWCMYNAYTGVKYYLYYTQQCGKDSRFALPAVEKTTFQGKLAEDTWRALEWTTVLRSATLFSSNTFALDEISCGIRHAFETWTVPI